MCGINVEETKAKIKELRNRKNYTISFLCDNLGLSQQALHKWEQSSNGTLPSLDNLVALAELYKVKLDDIIIRRPD